MNAARITALLVALLLGISALLGGCAGSSQAPLEQKPITERQREVEEQAPQDALKRAPEKGSDDMERLD